MLRGLAAVAVFTGHLRSLLFQDYSPSTTSLVFKALYFLTGFGHQAVVVFFVLSGFFVSRSIWLARDQCRWSWQWYLSQRLSRLWVVLVPALLMTATLDFVGMSLVPLAPQYQGTADSTVARYEVLPRLGPSVFLGNLFFVQTIWVPTYGSNGPLWSLANEFWYYMLFPCILQALGGPGSPFLRTLMGIVAVCLLLALPVGMLSGFLIWLMGFLVFILSRLVRLSRWLQRRWIAVGSVAAFLAALAASRLGLVSGLMAETLIGWTCAASLLTMFFLRRRTSRGYQAVARRLADISYSLYVFHLPACVLCATLCVGSTRWFATPGSLGKGVLCAALIVGYVMIMHRLFEARTEVARRAIALLLGRLTGPTKTG